MSNGMLGISEVRGVVADLLEKLGGQDGEEWLMATKRFLPKEEPWSVVFQQPSSSFPIWKTIKLGTGLVTADDFRQAFRKAGHCIGDWANDILGQRAFRAADQEIEVDLVVVSVKELGFPNGATRQDIYRKAQELGLMLCPPEVGPQLRLQYPDQPNNEWLYIGMEPIADSDGDLEVFGVERDDDGSWLNGYYGDADSFWYGDDRWVFLRRK